MGRNEFLRGKESRKGLGERIESASGKVCALGRWFGSDKNR